MRRILSITEAPRAHWVGDGFPVYPLFSGLSHQDVSPFIMLDYAAPYAFDPSSRRRGVGVHPHKGFETVTVVYSGELEHRDSTGAGGVIGPGDVQWMTAGNGILHEEFHSEGFARSGGTLEMVQLWVNLPRKDKAAKPGYQGLLDADIPVVPLAEDAGTARVIAGAFGGKAGPARTFTPISMIDIRLNAGKSATLALPEGHTTMAVVLAGQVTFNGEKDAQSGQMAMFDRTGGDITLATGGGAKVLVLSGEPINEPVAAHGPFVMNTFDEIRDAIADFNSGKFGTM